MTPPHSPTLRLRLLVLVVATSLPMLGIEVWRAASERQEAIVAAERELLQLARTMAEREDDSLQEAASLLHVLVRMPAIATAENDRCKPLLHEIVAEHTRIRDIVVLQQDGTVACRGTDYVQPAPNLSDRPWFKAALASDTPAPVVSRFLISRLSGKPSVIVARAMASAGPGAPQDAVVAVSLGLEWFSEVAARMQGPPGSLVMVLDTRDGTVLAHSQDAAAWVGRSFPGHPLLEAARGQADGSVQAVGIDGVVRHFGFAHLPNSSAASILVAVSIPSGMVVSAPTHHMIHAMYAIVGLILCSLVLAAVMIDRLVMSPLSKLNAMALALGRGDLSARLASGSLGVREFRLLADTLNRAAQQIEERDRKLEQMATRDGLTGLLNRRGFDDRIAQEWQRALRSGAPLAVAMIDVDRFKMLNDTFGHPVGDERLRQIARSLEGSVRSPCDLTARYGGEEFVIVLTGTCQDDAMRAAQRLVQAVHLLALPNPASEWGVVTISIGVAALDDSSAWANPAQLLAAADAALYRAKTLGRNRAVAAGSDRTLLPGTDVPGQPVALRRKRADVANGVGA